MSKQNDINEQMRAVLVDWIVEVHHNFDLNKETLFQAIWIIDTYLSTELIPRTKLQLLGITSLLIASKYNERYYPATIDFINITNKAYEIKELLEMESLVLKKLDFNILTPTPIQFYDILSRFFNFDSKQYNFGRYFLESYLIDYNMIIFPPSIIAFSCAYIVMKFFSIKDYKYRYNFIENNNNYIFNQKIQKVVKESARQLCFLVKNLNQTNLKTVKYKFSLDKFDNIAKYCEDY